MLIRIKDKFSFVQITILIKKKDHYLRKQDGVHLFGIQMVGLSGIQVAIEYGPICIQPLFDHWYTK